MYNVPFYKIERDGIRQTVKLVEEWKYNILCAISGEICFFIFMFSVLGMFISSVTGGSRNILCLSCKILFSVLRMFDISILQFMALKNRHTL